MVGFALLATLEAKPGKEDEVAEFLRSAVPLVEGEAATTAWFATRLGPSKFGIFDVFPDEAGRDAHLSGKVAAALMSRASDLFSRPPHIEKHDVLASKMRQSVRSKWFNADCIYAALVIVWIIFVWVAAFYVAAEAAADTSAGVGGTSFILAGALATAGIVTGFSVMEFLKAYKLCRHRR